MKKCLIVLVLVFVCGCNESQKVEQPKVPEKTYEQKLNDEWAGKKLNDLIAAPNWGAPQQILDNGADGKLVIWRNTRSYNAGIYTGYSTINKTKCWTVWVDPNNVIYKITYAKQ